MDMIDSLIHHLSTNLAFLSISTISDRYRIMVVKQIIVNIIIIG